MVGIDIGSKSIKVIELEKSGNKWNLKTSGAVGFKGVSPDKITDEKELQSLGEILRKTVNQISLTSKDVNISLPESIVFTRLIKFPMLTDEEISSAVKWESEQYIPIPVSEAVIQYMVLGKDEIKSQTSVLLVAAPKNSVEKFVKVIRYAGLIAVSAETELTAMARSLAPDKGISFLLDLGSSATDMSIVKDGKIVFTRSIPVAGEAFIRAVAQGLNITLQQAEEYKKTYGLSSTQLEGKVRIALEPVFKMVTEEIKKAIHFYQTEEKGEIPNALIVTGGASSMPDVIPYLTETTGIETIMGNAFGKLSLDVETAKSLSGYSSIYATAVGLAMREE
jgi:type IV pilus assembly protein PilM